MFDNEIDEIKTKYELNDIEILQLSMSVDKSCCMNCGGKCYIIIDTDKINSVAELKSTLLHEAGHIKENAMYHSSCTLNDIRHNEFLAIRWAVRNCVPFDKYIDAIRDGVRDVYQLAERFNITIESAIKIADYYESQVIEYIKLAHQRGRATV